MNSCQTSHIELLRPGTVIKVSCGPYYHVGMLADYYSRQGECMVIAFSEESGGLIEQPVSAFARGRPLTVAGYPGRLRPALVMQRARSMHERPYSLMSFNCEHFVRFAHGLPVESPQLKQWAFFGLFSAAMLFSARA